MSSPVEVMAYFCPQDHKDPARLKRARAVGYKEIPSDMSLIAKATPLYEGHCHPVPTIGNNLTEWVDSDPSSVALQAELAQEAGITAWVVLAYAGMLSGKCHKEMVRPLDVIASRDDIKFATMTCLGLPRIHLPVPASISGDNRAREAVFDPTMDTIRYMIDHSAEYWDNPRYLEFDGKPVVQFYGFKRSNLQKFALPDGESLAESILEYARSRYSVDVHLMANAFDVNEEKALRSAGFRHITTYSHLADFQVRNHDPESNEENVQYTDFQEYRAQLRKRMDDWEKMKGNPSTDTFTPSVVVGWDASARGETNQELDDIRGKFPWTPIIRDSSPENFRMGLKTVWEFLQYLPPEKRVLLICSWNEEGNGSSLLPRVNDDNKSTNNLQELKDFLAIIAKQM